MISRVGNDEKGEKLHDYLENNGIGTDNIQEDRENPTGMVKVMLSEKGSATYEISYPAAWDKIESNDQVLKAVKEADVFVFGSLVCRDEVSRKTLFECLNKAKWKVFDLNLRPPHYDLRVLNELMQNSDFLKFNDDELFEIAESLGSVYNSLEQNLMFISEKTNTSSICVTKGNHGAVFLHDEKLYYNSGFKTKVKDTVGAGDSFLASLIAGLLKNEDPQSSLDFACAVGALVAGEDGANPIIKKSYIQEFMFPG
jgi:fructokinase